VAGRLDGKVCVITGTASGIGRASAELFMSEGARVVGVDLSPDASGDLAVQTDVTDEEQVRALYTRVREEFGRIDVLFNNAGISPDEDRSILDTDYEAWKRVQDVNLASVFYCCKHGIPHLIDGGGGSVINTASFVAVVGAAVSQISYTASKGGVLAMSRASTRSARGRSTRRYCRSCSPRIRSRRSAAWSMCRRGASPSRARSRTGRCSSPATSRPTSTPPPLWSTAV
jgi:NAD(P)-dependent dehydrogenase (short-subunit alcohol dehydrogenase family)